MHFLQAFVTCEILSSEYEWDACGKIFQMPRSEKILLFSHSLIDIELFPAEGYNTVTERT